MQKYPLWDVRSGDLLLIINRHNNWIAAAAFSPDGRTLASGGAGQIIYLWDTHTGECRCRMPGHTANSPDGQLLASGSQDKMVMVWDVSTATATEQAKILYTLSGHANWVNAVAFSPDGQTLASSSLDKTVRLWRLESGKSLLCLDGHDSPVYGVIFPEDGDTVVSGSSSGMIREWDAATGEQLSAWHLPRPFEGTNIRGVSVITNAQRASLLALGAVDDNMTGLS